MKHFFLVLGAAGWLLGEPVSPFAQTATQTPPAAIVEAVNAPSLQTALPLKAQYSWGYAGADGQGKGTLNLLLEPDAGRLLLELHGLGERIALLSGEAGGAYRLQIPRKSLDITQPSLEALQLPFLSKVGSVDRLYRFLHDGEFPGVKVTKKDASGPLKLRYRGSDERGKEYMVWLERTRWEKGR